jgi:hypothetical protein
VYYLRRKSYTLEYLNGQILTKNNSNVAKRFYASQLLNSNGDENNYMTFEKALKLNNVIYLPDKDINII